MCAVRNRNANDCRMASSSSMTWTIKASDGIADLLRADGTDRKAEDCAAIGVGFHPDSTPMSLNDRARNRQPDSHALRLGRNKRLEQLSGNLGRNAGTGVGHADHQHVVVDRVGGEDQLALLGLLHGFNGVSDQVQQHLLNLYLVGEYEVVGSTELKADANALILGPNQRKRAGLFDELDDAFDARLAF